MEDVLYIIRVILKLSFFVWFTCLLYLSLKKCFWQEGLRKGIFVILSLVMSPYLSVIVSYIAGGFFSHLLEMVIGSKISISTNTLSTIVNSVVIPILYLILIMVFAKLMGKYLHAREVNSIRFVYLMFSTISVISLRGTGNGLMFSNRNITEIIDIVGEIILYLAGWLFYRLNISQLAEMESERISVKVNWEIFTIPPALFSFLYMIFITLMVGANNAKDFDGKTAFVVYVFSSIITFLFIWAFHVIIKNINVTNEAVKAKDEAVEAKNEVKSLSVEVMEALAHTIDAKDEYTRGHSVRVAKYSRMLAEKLGLSAEDCENVYYMALLHDIGKIGVPNAIINSPTRLTDEEFGVIKTHPGVGYDILAEIKSRPDLSTGARWHHERYDGKGYPDGKAGEDIPFFARIIAVADSYDAMTSNRSYRKYMPQDAVRSEIEKNSGTQFDPNVVKCMLEIIDEDKNYELHE